MQQDIEGFVKSRTQCARGEASHLRSGGLLQPLLIPNSAGEKISLDPKLGLSTREDGYDGIKTIMCGLTRMPLCPDATDGNHRKFGKDH